MKTINIDELRKRLILPNGDHYLHTEVIGDKKPPIMETVKTATIAMMALKRLGLNPKSLLEHNSYTGMSIHAKTIGEF